MNFHIRQTRHAALALSVLAATIVAACGGYGGGGGLAGCLGYGGGGGGGLGGSGSCSGNPAPGPTADGAAQAVAMLLTGESATTVPTFGEVLGYNLGNSPAAFASGSNVINLTANQPVQFYNVEAAGGNPHTASGLGAWSGSFPSAGPPSAAQNASAAGTAINAAGFSTGRINPGQLSLVYSSGTPGMTVIGCYYHYLSNGVRTVAIVM